MADPSIRWWVISDHTLRDALQRAHNGEDPGVIEAEIYANSDRIDVDPDETGDRT